MAKSVSPSKGGAARGRPKTKIQERKESGAAEPRGKSAGRSKSRGRSPTPKVTKETKRKSSTSAKRASSKSQASRGRSQSRSRKFEPKQRSRSASRKSVPRRSAAVEKPLEKEKKETSVARSRRSVAAPREASKPRSSVSAASDAPLTRSAISGDKSPYPKTSKVVDFFAKFNKQVKAFGYRRTFVATWWLLSFPVFVLGLHLLCSRDNCYIRFNPTIPKALRVYADPLVLGYGAGVVALQCLLSALPVGRQVHGFGYRRISHLYRSNSLLCLVVSVALFCVGVFYLRLPNTLILQTHRFKCVSAATLLSFIISLVLYAKSFIRVSRSLNHGSPCSPGIQGNYIHDFVHGREVSPRIGRTFDLGLVLVRAGNCIWVLAVLSACIFARTPSGLIFGMSYSVALVSFLQLLYVFLGSLNEVYQLKSAFIQQGVGFLYVFSTIVLAPFCSTLPLRYLVDAKVPDLPLPAYPAILLLSLIGLFLIHYSNSLKYHNARSGGKTLRHGPWSFVRHPNYLGELCCILAWTIPCGKTLLPYAHLAFVALLVIFRSIMCEKDTNADYRNYQQQVRYRVLPPIF
ncbi:delta(14)-sterol reductase-like [Varroa jacobsoni]|uniref:Uncharacterized protein n=1 Tax=Varroa destructor TaxID=109461 RepID=A0A7M7J624_VARDE|nr:delta(14)-sterol reductase-like [Varroa destructor]XP_022696994.1 delta(14)-sterol reductase-like [Varroa jacobsoni]